MNRRWFARKNIILRGEGVQIETATQQQATINGTPIATFSNIPTEKVVLGTQGGAILPGAETDILWNGAVTPVSTNGITTVVGTNQLQTTRRGLYQFLVRIDASAECIARVTLESPIGTIVNQGTVHITTVGGSAKGLYTFFTDVTVSTAVLHKFTIRGDSYPIAGAPITFANTSTVEVVLWERKF